MIYECDSCGNPLPPGAMACPSCREIFDEAVPPHAAAPAGTPIPIGPTGLGRTRRAPAPSPVGPRLADLGPLGWSKRASASLLCLVGIGVGLTVILTSAGSHGGPVAAAAGAAAAPPLSAPQSNPAAFAVPDAARHAAREISAPVLSLSQTNSGFTSLAYARAYDRFGRAILRRDRDVKGVAVSNGDSASGFFVMVKEYRIPASRAASRASRYLAQFVAMRGKYFGPEEAQKADLTVRSGDESIMATADQDGAKPDCIFYDTCGRQDAAEAAAPPTLDTAIARLQEKCGPGVTGDDLLRVANKAHDLLAARGIEEDPASIASHVADTIPAGYQPGKGVTDLFATYITLREDGGN